MREWVARFGAPAKITTDQGRQFESNLFKELAAKIGAKKIRTNAYHPSANGKIERWHRSLKAAIMAYATPRWTEILPLIMLGLRSAINSDLGVSPAQMTYGTELRLPGEFFAADNEARPIPNAREFVERLGIALREFARSTRRHGESPIYVPSALENCSHIFLREEVRKALTPPYKGPYKVIQRDKKSMVISRNGKDERVTIDRVKPAFLLREPEPQRLTDEPEEKKTATRPRRVVRFQEKYSK
jgi:cleavage and polyadenylation specificity factor subunit 1